MEMGRQRFWFAALLLAFVLQACGTTSVSQVVSPSPGGSPIASPSSPSPSALPSAPADWKSITDSTYGYVFSYPGGWTDVTAATGATHGHALASRADLTSFYPLKPGDRALYVNATPPQAVVGCSEPVNPDEKASTTLGGEVATAYVRHGDQGDPTIWVLDVIAKHVGVCYQLQLLSGGDFTEADSKAMMGEIQGTFRFGA